METDFQRAFLSLVRLGLRLESHIGLDFENTFKAIDWDVMQTLASEHGLSSIVVDGLGRIPAVLKPKKPVLLQWIGEALQGESIYEAQWKAACEMSLIFERKAIRTYILKGFVISECYPNPTHRVSVDLDSFLISTKGDSDAWELGNQLMEQCGFEVDRSFYKNSTINIPGLTVENHQYMTPIRGSKRLKKLEKLLQCYMHSDKGEDKFEGTCMYRPPVMVTALFLIEHAYAHFLHEGLTWRMVLDWMMFSKKHAQMIDWNTLNAMIDEFGFRKFYDTFVRLGGYLLGELPASELTRMDHKMLSDVWASLDLHDFHGVKGKIALASNSIRATWKYHYFTPDLMITDLFRRVIGFVFERHPKLN